MIASLLLLVRLAEPILWEKPGAPILEVSTAPSAPFLFERELAGGTSPKVIVSDARGRKWIVKGGHESKPEVFATWFIRSLGFHADTLHFVRAGKIERVGKLKRAWWFIQRDGAFRDASFERIEDGGKYVAGKSWRWDDPALNSRVEFRALKIAVMLLSNWDNKDARNRIFGTNTGIAQRAGGGRIFYVVDWGQSLGSWGRFYGRTDWNCASFRRQTPAFVTGVKNGRVQFGYAGQHTNDFKYGILVSDVQWLLPLLDRLTDEHLTAALLYSGATQQESSCFASELRARVEQLRKAAGERN